PTKTLADRVRHVVQSCFNGKRIIIFSGGDAKDTPAVLEEIRGIRDDGGFGSIMGRNSFQRPKEEAIKLLRDVMGIHQGKRPPPRAGPGAPPRRRALPRRGRATPPASNAGSCHASPPRSAGVAACAARGAGISACRSVW